MSYHEGVAATTPHLYPHLDLYRHGTLAPLRERRHVGRSRVVRDGIVRGSESRTAPGEKFTLTSEDAELFQQFREFQAFRRSKAALVQHSPEAVEDEPLPENFIATCDGASKRKKRKMRKIHGPYPHRSKWRIFTYHQGCREVSFFETKEAAEAEIKRLRKQAAIEAGATFSELLTDYQAHLTSKKLKPVSIYTTLYRLRLFLGPVLDCVSQVLTPQQAAKLTEELKTAKTKRGKDISPDLQLNTLSETKTFVRWLKRQGILKGDPMADIKIDLEKNKGKFQLTIDEARRWLARAVELADQGDTTAIAVMPTLLLGLRAGEVVKAVVRELDDGGTIFRVTNAKTPKGNRALRIPELLQPYLRKLAEGKKPTDSLFGVTRFQVLGGVRRICKEVGVPIVCAHSMRGLHSSLALGAGATGQAVANALGHESFSTTVRHYADPSAVGDAQARRAQEVLLGPKVGNNSRGKLFPTAPESPGLPS